MLALWRGLDTVRRKLAGIDHAVINQAASRNIAATRGATRGVRRDLLTGQQPAHPLQLAGIRTDEDGELLFVLHCPSPSSLLTM